jgi:hypothetical protein
VQLRRRSEDALNEDGSIHLITPYRSRALCGAESGMATSTRSAVTCKRCLELPVPGPPGARPRAGRASRSVITVRLSPDELARWRAAAGPVALGRWIRDRIENSMKGHVK